MVLCQLCNLYDKHHIPIICITCNNNLTNFMICGKCSEELSQCQLCTKHLNIKKSLLPFKRFGNLKININIK